MAISQNYFIIYRYIIAI